MVHTKKIKVVWTYRRFGVGGSEMFALNVLPGLKEHFDVSVLLTSGVGRLAEQLSELGIRVIEAKMKGKFHRRRIKSGAAYLAELNPDILHLHSFDNYFLVRIAAFLANVPVIITHHHTMPAERYNRKLRRAETHLLPATDRSLFVSKAGLEEFWGFMKDHVDSHLKDRLGILRDAFDIDALRKEGHNVAVRKLREQYSLSPNARIIGAIARIHPVKNIELLIETVALLRKKIPGIACFILGEGDMAYLKELQEQAAAFNVDDACIFTGFQENVTAFINMFEVTVLTSHYEGFGRCLVESFAMGTPVVAPRIPAISEIVEPGETGFLAEPDSAQDFADRIETLLEHNELRSRLGENAAGRARDFDLGACIEKLCELYEHLYTTRAPEIKSAKKKYRLRYRFTRKI